MVEQEMEERPDLVSSQHDSRAVLATSNGNKEAASCSTIRGSKKLGSWVNNWTSWWSLLLEKIKGKLRITRALDTLHENLNDELMGILRVHNQYASYIIKYDEILSERGH